MKDNLLNKEKITEVLYNSRNIQFAYLIGSLARDKARFGSDLDIAVYFEDKPNLLDIGMLVNELEKVTEYNVDLILLNDLYNSNPKLAYSVIGEGDLLLCRNEKLLISYKANTYMEYFDFKPAADLFYRKLRERIINNRFAVRDNEA